RRAWNEYRQAREAAGIHFDLKEVAPPPVPDDENFALTPVVASCYLQMLNEHGQRHPYNTNVVNQLNFNLYFPDSAIAQKDLKIGSWQKGTFTDLRPWQNYYRAQPTTTAPAQSVAEAPFPVSPQPQTPAVDVLLALSKYDATLDALRAAAKLPYARFPLEYDSAEPPTILLPHLANIKKTVVFLQLRSIAELDAGQPDQALADWKLGLRCNEALRQEPFLISQLVEIAGQNILTQPLWEGLARHQWSDVQLADIEATLAGQDYPANFRTGMLGELACGIGSVEYLRRSRNFGELVSWTSSSRQNDMPDPMELLYAMAFHLMPDGWFYQMERNLAQMYERYSLPLVDQTNRIISPTLNRQLATEAGIRLQTKSVANAATRLLFPALGRASLKTAQCQTMVNEARIACALERYRLAHGQYPDSLADLTPQFLVTVPHDLINGEPLHYRREAGDRFTLYSVGWNQRDDGGRVVLGKGETPSADPDQGDWVWTYPAHVD
ncbi:MAG TPA: hypothetical protein VL527_09940, partial [Dongiaceae bacterium]|nr:hypothetical protein [Dongiaceae bacterium]